MKPTIDFLKNQPNSIPRLAAIWHEVLGKKWAPDVSLQQVKQRFSDHLNDTTLPMTLVALDNDIPIGMCSLRTNDGILPNLSPWLGSLVVDPRHQSQGVGEMLVNAIKQNALNLGFAKVYLFAFDPTIPEYYSRLGWLKIGMDEFKAHPVTVMEILL